MMAKTIKVNAKTYDALVALAAKTGRSLGEVTDDVFTDRFARFMDGVKELPASGIGKALVALKGGGASSPPKSDSAKSESTNSYKNGDAFDFTIGEAGDKKASAAVVKGGPAPDKTTPKQTYFCEHCEAEVFEGDEACSACGTRLAWPGEKAPSEGSANWLWVAGAILALLALPQFQGKAEPAAPGVM